jgi:insulinase (Peptidase family M16)
LLLNPGAIEYAHKIVLVLSVNSARLPRRVAGKRMDGSGEHYHPESLDCAIQSCKFRKGVSVMRLRTFSATFLMVALLVPATTFAQRIKSGVAAAGPRAAAPLPPINYTEFKLRNGLRVILHEDHSTPIVGVNLWYHVGSKNEVPGKTGYAHLFEHMMFQGSKNYDDDYFKPIQEAGGTLNGSTNPDRTNYFEVVPSNFLELALFMEADRMGGLLDVLNEAKLANQRDVVMNEKRQTTITVPMV